MYILFIPGQKNAIQGRNRQRIERGRDDDEAKEPGLNILIAYGLRCCAPSPSPTVLHDKLGIRMLLRVQLLCVAVAVSSQRVYSAAHAAHSADELMTRPDPVGVEALADAVAAPPQACTPKLLGSSLDAPAHDLLQTAAPQTSAACGAACCANPKCAGALFEPQSAVKFGGCLAGKPCCFMKTSVADHRPSPKPVKGGSDLWEIPGRDQDDEKLTFLSATLGSHMVLQRGPQQAVLWGFTAPGSTVTTTMAPSVCDNTINATLAACAAQSFSAVADAKGTWRQKLPATPVRTWLFSFSLLVSIPSLSWQTIVAVFHADTQQNEGRVCVCVRSQAGKTSYSFSFASSSALKETANITGERI
jgi:hypothetical protein